MRSFFRWTTLILGIAITWWGITLLSVREQALNPDTYTEALSQAGVYQALTEVIQEKATGAIKVYSKELVSGIAQKRTEEGKETAFQPVFIWLLNTLVDQQSETVVERIFDSFRLETIIAENFEVMITQSLAWLNGQATDPSWWKYIPSNDTIDQARQEGLASLVISSASASLSGGRNLKVESITRTVVGTIVPQLVPETTKLAIESFVTRYQLKAFVEDTYSLLEQANQLKISLYSLREAVGRTYTVGWVSFISGMILLAISLLLTRKNRLATFLRTLTALGVLLVVMALIYYSMGFQMTAKYLPALTLEIKDPAISLTSKTALITSVETATKLVLQNLLLPSFWIGVFLMVIAGSSFLVIEIAQPKTKKNQAKTAKT